MAIEEITEAVLKSRIHRALIKQLPLVTDSMVNMAYQDGHFAEFVGTVHRTKQTERSRAAGICRRLGHRVTAAQILKGGC